MKTEKLFSRIGRTALIAVSLLAAPFLTGCSSESDAPNPDAEQTGEPRVHIYFGTPAMSVGTRAEQQSTDGITMPVLDKEAAITSLYLFVYSVKTTDGTETSQLSFAYNLSSNLLNQNVKSWKKASPEGGIALPKGDYKFYLLANVDKFQNTSSFTGITTTGALPDNLKNQDESFIKNLEMDKFLAISDSKVSTNYLSSSTFGLPMAMMCEDVMTGGALDSGNNILNQKTYKDNGGVVSIGDNSINLYCDMTFLCSAVRCSFLYDKSTFSWDIASFEAISPALTVSNIVMKETLGTLATNDDDFTEATFSTAGSSYLLKDGETEVTFAEFINKPFTLKTTITAANVSQAYQSVIYLPSNYSMTKKTELAFKCELMPTTSNVKTARTFHITLPNSDTSDAAPANQLARGYFYDIIGKISSTGADFQVSVKKWENGTTQAIPL